MRPVDEYALCGKTLLDVEVIGKSPFEQLAFYCSDGTEYRQRHVRDHTEIVEVENVRGDCASLGGAVLDVDREEIRLGPELLLTYVVLVAPKGCLTILWRGEGGGGEMYLGVDFFER